MLKALEAAPATPQGLTLLARTLPATLAPRCVMVVGTSYMTLAFVPTVDRSILASIHVHVPHDIPTGCCSSSPNGWASLRTWPSSCTGRSRSSRYLQHTYKQTHTRSQAVVIGVRPQSTTFQLSHTYTQSRLESGYPPTHPSNTYTYPQNPQHPTTDARPQPHEGPRPERAGAAGAPAGHFAVAGRHRAVRGRESGHVGLAGAYAGGGGGGDDGCGWGGGWGRAFVKRRDGGG